MTTDNLALGMVLTLHNKASLVAVGTKEDWDVPIVSVEEEVVRVLELIVEPFLSSSLSTRNGATKGNLSS